MYVYLSIFMYIPSCIHVYVLYAYFFMHACMYVYVYVWVYVCMCYCALKRGATLAAEMESSPNSSFKASSMMRSDLTAPGVRCMYVCTVCMYVWCALTWLRWGRRYPGTGRDCDCRTHWLHREDLSTWKWKYESKSTYWRVNLHTYIQSKQPCILK